MATIEITTENFEKEVMQSKLPVIIDFWASWCGPCVPPETIILGDNKPISEFKNGDYAFGLTGHNKVVHTSMRPYHDSIIKIKANGLLSIEITPEHPMLIATSESSDRLELVSKPYWKEAKNVASKGNKNDGDYLVIPRIKGIVDLDKISLLKYIKKGHINMAKAKNVPLIFPLNEDTAWLLGLYVAEGNASDNTIVFNLGAREKDLQSKIIKIGKGLNYSLCINSPVNGAVKVSIKSRLLKRALPIWCGKGALNKKIPDFIMLHKNNDILNAFLDGYLAGDGTIIKERGVQSARTISRTLAMQLQLLYARLGIFSTIQKYGTDGLSKIQNRVVNTHVIYTISTAINGTTKAIINKDNILTPIRKVEEIKYNGNVCNLETKDNTYLVNNAIVHNCRMFSPIIDEVSEEFKGKVVFGKINTDENSDIATQYNIMSIPTAMIFKNGKIKATSIGAIPKESLRKWVKENM